MRIRDWSSDVCSSDLIGDRFSLRGKGIVGILAADSVDLDQVAHAGRAVVDRQEGRLGAGEFGRRTLDRCLIGRGINLVEKLALGDDRAFLEQTPEHDPAYLWTDVRHHEGVGAPGKLGDEIDRTSVVSGKSG